MFTEGQLGALPHNFLFQDPGVIDRAPMFSNLARGRAKKEAGTETQRGN